MPLRANNETNTTDQVLAALALQLPNDPQTLSPNTALGLAGGSVLINDDSPLLLDTASWPALLIEEGAQPSARIYPRTWQKKLTVYVFYVDRWDQQEQNLDAIWAAINEDVQRMIANLTDNLTLTINGVRNCLHIASIEPSPRTQKVIDDETYGVPVVQRMITISINLIPYVAAS